jgi:hypothetical protein
MLLLLLLLLLMQIILLMMIHLNVADGDVDVASAAAQCCR